MSSSVSELVKEGNLTALLREWSAGNSYAFEQLIPLVYDELRRLAHLKMRGERLGHTLQTTGLVNEVLVRLLERHQVDWQNSEQFFSIAAREMRRVLVEYARQRNAQRRGGDWQRIKARDSLATEEIVEQEAAPDYEQQLVDCLAVHEALEQLYEEAPKAALVVELRETLGLENKLVAELLNVSEAAVTKRYQYGISLLKRKLSLAADKRA